MTSIIKDRTGLPIFNSFGVYLCSLLVISNLSLSQTKTLSAEDILDQSISASGGLTSYEDAQSSLQSYDLIQDQRRIASILIIRERGKRYLRSIISLNYTPSTRIFNGDTFYQLYGEEVTTLSGNDIPDDIYHKTYLTPEEGYLAQNFNLERMENEQIGDQKFYTLYADNGKGYGTINYFDIQSGQLNMIVYEGSNKAILAQRKEHDGLELPSAIINKEEDGSVNVLQLTHHNSSYPIPNELFEIADDIESSLSDDQRFGSYLHQDGSKMLRSKNETLIIQKGDTTKYMTNWRFKNTFSLVDIDRLKNKENISSSDVILVKILNSYGQDQYLHILQNGRSRIEKWTQE